MAGTLPMLKLAVPAIADFRRDFPKVDIFIEREIAINIRRLADDSEIDFGLMPALKPIAGLEVLFSSKPWLIYPESSDFRVPCNPSLADLARLRFITFKSRQRYEDLGYYDKNSGLGEVIANNSVLSVNNNEMMLHFIACGVGVGIMDEHCFKAHTERKFATNLKSVDIGSLLPDRLYGIYSRPGKKMSPQSAELIRRLRTRFMDTRAGNQSVEIMAAKSL
ncbi:MAG: substrate-binding domain-containing protein, partial [Desulfovibrio sp.]|nr:substrate-binding domain-containing protein [Desulfovibrio sp.]